MAAVGTATDKGTIHVKTSTLTLVIDQTASNDYTPKMKLEGHIGVWFVPAAGASETVVTNGIKMQLTLTQSEGWTYQPSLLDDEGSETATDIFTVNSTPLTISTGVEGNYIKHSEVAPFEITADVINSLITFNVHEEIDTIEEWTYFQGRLVNEKKFTVTISEYTGS